MPGLPLLSYPDADSALADALRLAEGMSYKNALADLPFGGAKAVLRKPAGDYDRAALFRAFGRVVEGLGGLYVTAEDVGTTVADMQEIAGVTRHVAGLPPAKGRAGAIRRHGPRAACSDRCRRRRASRWGATWPG